MLGVVVVLVAIAIVVLANVKGMRRDLREKALRDKAAEEQFRAVLARNGLDETPDGEEGRRRRLRLLPPIFVGLAGSGFAEWMRQHPATGIAGTLVSLAAVMTLLFSGSSTSDTHRADPPGRPVQTTAPGAPTSPTEQPAPSDTPSTPPTDTRTRTTAAPVTVTDAHSGPPPVTTTTVATPPTRTSTPPPLPGLPVPPPTPEGCLLDVTLDPLLDLCVAPVS